MCGSANMAGICYTPLGSGSAQLIPMHGMNFRNPLTRVATALLLHFYIMQLCLGTQIPRLTINQFNFRNMLGITNNNNNTNNS